MSDDTPPSPNDTSSPSSPPIPEDIGRGKKILLIEDDNVTRTLISRILEKYGYELCITTNGQEGWEKLSPEYLPHLIIADVLMPEMDGFSVFKELKGHEETKDIPVLIISSRRLMAESFLAMGADQFLAKPFNAEELIRCVVKLARERPAAGTSDEEDSSEESEK